MGGNLVVGARVLALAFALIATSLFPASPTQAANGNSPDQVVLVEPNGRWHIRTPGAADYTFSYGAAGDIPLLGDWDGDGIDTPGVYRPSNGSAHLTNRIPLDGSAGFPELTFFFGSPGDTVFAGDWDDNGTDTRGLSRNGRIFLTNINATSIGGDVSWFGTPDDIPIGGDPNGVGGDGLFVHRPASSTVWFTNSAAADNVATTDGSLYFGKRSDRLVVGDWNGDGIDSPGVFRPLTSTVFLRNPLWSGNAQYSYWFGRSDWYPVAGNIHLHIKPTGPIAPLTGLAGGDPSQRVVIAKISNSWKARPQAGINDADLVMEVIVEGGVGRWIALFQTSLPEIVGPLRSVREVDPKLIEPFDARVLHSGGVAEVREAIAGVGVDEGHGRIPGYFREADRRAVYDLMYDFAELPPTDWHGTVEPVLRYDLLAPAAGQPATTINLAMSPPNILSWEFRDGSYFRSQSGSESVDAAGEQISAATVAVAFVEEIDSGRFDSAGSPVPDYQVTGRGDGVVFRDGRAFPGTWERKGTDEFFTWLDAAGRPIPMVPGRTWIHVTPTTGSLDWS